MKRPLITRIAALTVFYLIVFFGLILLQFSGKENFSLSIGAMNIRGRYLHDSQLAAQANQSFQEITGGARVFFGGLEFNLNEDRGKGLALLEENSVYYVNPEYLFLTENTARFRLPGGAELIFSSYDSERGSELRINAVFTEDIKEIVIPITIRRSSLVTDNEQLGIRYGGSFYSFGGRGNELENGKITLTSENFYISYRSRDDLDIFNPADFIITQSQNYQNEIQNWRDINFSFWNQNTSTLQNDDDITAYLAESLIRGNYQRAISLIPANFINSSRQTYRTALYLGGIINAYRPLASEERDRLNLISGLIGTGSPEIFKEKNVLDFLITRNNTSLANDVINFTRSISSETVVLEYCPGLLEVYDDFNRWYPAAGNPAEHLTEQILIIISENLTRIEESDLLFIKGFEEADNEFSLRLGKTLVSFAEKNQEKEWEDIGKSLILSVFFTGENYEGKLYNILNSGDNVPRAARLSDTHWAWTVSSSASSSYIDGNLNVSVSFPVNLTHYMVVFGVRPFLKIQIHGIDFRTDSQFERYDSSGWVYYAQDQILILKLKHRLTIEDIRVFYVPDALPPAPQPVQQPSAPAEEEQYTPPRPETSSIYD